MVFPSLQLPGEDAVFPIGHGQEDGHDQRGEQLQVVSVQAQPQHHLDDQVIDDGAQGHGQQLQGEVPEELTEDHLADDHGRQADDDGAPAHGYVREALVLGHEGAGEGDQAVADHQTNELAGVRVDALGPGHLLVGAHGPEAAAVFRAEEPIHDADEHEGQEQHQPDGVIQRQVPHVAQGHQHVLILVDAHGDVGPGTEIRTDALDPQVDGIEGKLGQDTGEDGRDAHGGMEDAGDRTGQHAHDEGNEGGQPGIDAAGDQDRRDGAAGGERAVHRQVRDIQDAEGDVDPDGHDAPDETLGHGAGKLVKKLCNVHVIPPE